ncbi:MAG: class I SAM-dependent methyltransferase [Desulfocapsa sp.]|nr:class I SAM-dependent methyltransferase [Desulfocapsa sp.]
MMHPELTYDDLDWDKLWQNARAKKSWTAKGPADWDKKAESFAKRNSDSLFVDLVLDHIPLDSKTTVLDGGSGPGTLALPLSNRVKSVTAIDYSKGMLEVLNNRAREQNISNLRTVLGSWEDDWDALQIKKHDICIACRSLSVNNLQKALAKLNDYAKRSVFVVDRISPTPFDNGAFTAINRPFRSGPDYIYTINTLYSMDIHPCVDIISLKKTVSFSSMDEALESYRWMFQDLTRKEERKLKEYIQSNSTTENNGTLIVNRPYPSRWALISWDKNDQ